ncbi:MAG: hypothetical protein EOO59_14220 [Hymenobacter sp.]|nr:MAG: hypothetical protein EOO59_14220 [Hymenobacter sp.]
MPRTRLLLAAALPLLGACRPDASSEAPPRLKPLLETLPTGYRPFNRQDTLASYWAPDSLVTDSLFAFTAAHRSQVLLRVRFVPASAVAAARLDTLRFRRTTSTSLAEYNRPGYCWEFFPGRYWVPDLTETPDRVPLRLRMQYEWRLSLRESRGYERNRYLVDYPFETVAQARVSDSVVYVRAVPMLADQPRLDTLYPYYRGGLHHRRIPMVADAPDTTRHALLRLSFRVLSHSAD